MATVTLGSIKFNWKGAYNSSTAYAVDDVVSSGGNSYVCIQAHTNQAVGNATAYWNIMSAAGTDADLLSISSTAQGDIYYNSGSAIARLGAGTSGQFLKTQGTGANPAWADAGGGLQSIQSFTSSGTYTKPAGINKIKVYITGAGGSGSYGGGSNYSGGGGAAGGTAIELLDATSITTVAVTIASATSNNSNAAGSTGGSSSFGSYCSATGGEGGNVGGAIGGTQRAGIGSGGTLNLRGGAGNCGVDSSVAIGGQNGGDSYWGGSGNGAYVNSSQAGINGGGGSGGYSGNQGTNGGAGFCVVEEYK